MLDTVYVNINEKHSSNHKMNIDIYSDNWCLYDNYTHSCRTHKSLYESYNDNTPEHNIINSINSKYLHNACYTLLSKSLSLHKINCFNYVKHSKKITNQSAFSLGNYFILWCMTNRIFKHYKNINTHTMLKYVGNELADELKMANRLLTDNQKMLLGQLFFKTMKIRIRTDYGYFRKSKDIVIDLGYVIYDKYILLCDRKFDNLEKCNRISSCLGVMKKYDNTRYITTIYGDTFKYSYNSQGEMYFINDGEYTYVNNDAAHKEFAIMYYFVYINFVLSVYNLYYDFNKQERAFYKNYTGIRIWYNKTGQTIYTYEYNDIDHRWEWRGPDGLLIFVKYYNGETLCDYKKYVKMIQFLYDFYSNNTLFR